MHQCSHLAYLAADFRIKLNPTLSSLMTAEQFGIPLFLVWYGFTTVWYYPFILTAVGFPATMLLVMIEKAIKLHKSAWAISISGILFLPALLYLMMVHVSTAGS